MERIPNCKHGDIMDKLNQWEKLAALFQNKIIEVLEWNKEVLIEDSSVKVEEINGSHKITMIYTVKGHMNGETEE